MAEGQGHKMLLKAKHMAMVLGHLVAEQLLGSQWRLITGRTPQSRIWTIPTQRRYSLYNLE